MVVTTHHSFISISDVELMPGTRLTMKINR